jgi:probable phosphoglycerate mutase
LRLLLVRHGETEGNVSRRLQGPDDPLTERGRRQAEEIAAHLSGRDDVVALYASPYRRAFDTARAIGGALGVEPEPRPALAELDVGDAAGYRFEAWVEEFPEEAERFRTRGWTTPGPEGRAGGTSRCAPRGDRTHPRGPRHEAGAVVVVSHGGALAWIIAHLLGEPKGSGLQLRQARQLLHHGGRDPGRRQGAREFLYTNEVGHLSPDPDEEAATGRDPVD